MRPAQIRMSPALAGSPVRPSSTNSPAAESSRAWLSASACNCRDCCPSESASPKDTRYVRVLEIGSAEVDLELIACLRVEPRLGIQPSDIGVDVHHEHGAAGAREDVQVIDVELPVLAGQRRIKVMRHGWSPLCEITCFRVCREMAAGITGQMTRLARRAVQEPSPGDAGGRLRAQASQINSNKAGPEAKTPDRGRGT